MLDKLSCVVGLLTMVRCHAADHAATAAPSLVLALVRSGHQQSGGAQPPYKCSPTPTHFSVMLVLSKLPVLVSKLLFLAQRRARQSNPRQS